MPAALTHFLGELHHLVDGLPAVEAHDEILDHGRQRGVIFRRTIPNFVTAHLNAAVTKILAGMELSMADIDRFICHPGGARVITALEAAFSLNQGTLDHERQIIADYGNMSAPTVLFVLERARAKGLPARSLLTALGPGFTASCVTLRHAA